MGRTLVPSMYKQPDPNTEPDLDEDFEEAWLEQAEASAEIEDDWRFDEEAG
jgi:hypothetical protein